MNWKKFLLLLVIIIDNCYYFGDIIRDIDINFGDISLDKKSYKTEYKNILITTFHAKLSLVQNYCLLGSIR